MCTAASVEVAGRTAGAHGAGPNVRELQALGGLLGGSVSPPVKWDSQSYPGLLLEVSLCCP